MPSKTGRNVWCRPPFEDLDAERPGAVGGPFYPPAPGLRRGPRGRSPRIL